MQSVRRSATYLSRSDDIIKGVPMRRARALLAGGAAVVATIAVGGTGPASAVGGHRAFATELSGAAEVPGPGDPDGRGGAAIVINPVRGRICYALAVKDIAPAVMAHIHVGASNVAGPVVFHFVPPTPGSARCTAIDKPLAQAIVDNPTNYYVNVHTADFPSGAVRGQLG